jgi:DNA (cytosine-5)-methyltransferase 1
MKPKLLDLFCAAGGAGMGYSLAGFDIVGVDNKPQPHYPFEFVLADALDYLVNRWRDFDAIHASPPCQRYSKATNNLWAGKVESHPDLISELRDILISTGKPYIIENVRKAPVKTNLMLCGTMFNLRIAKHRYFETNFMPFVLLPPCDHSDVYDPWNGVGRTAEKYRQAQGTPWIPSQGGASRKMGVTGDVSNAIPPAYTEFIGSHLRACLTPHGADSLPGSVLAGLSAR